MNTQNQSVIRVGAIYKMPLTEKDGMRLKPGETFRNKYFVVLGFDGKRVKVASFIINSVINYNLFMYIGPYQHELVGTNYPFMTKQKSYVDCSRLRALPVDRVMRDAQYVCDMAAEDLAEVMIHVKDSPLISNETLMDFGLVPPATKGGTADDGQKCP